MAAASGWDFATTFPAPLPEAIAEGRLYFGDAEPENLAALHAEHILACRGSLATERTMLDAAVRGVSPYTGRPARTQATRDALAERTAGRAVEARRHYEELLEAYAECFGWDAAGALQAHVESGTPAVPEPPPPESGDPKGPAETVADGGRTSGPQLALFS